MWKRKILVSFGIHRANYVYYNIVFVCISLHNTVQGARNVGKYDIRNENPRSAGVTINTINTSRKCEQVSFWFIKKSRVYSIKMLSFCV